MCQRPAALIARKHGEEHREQPPPPAWPHDAMKRWPVCLRLPCKPCARLHASLLDRQNPQLSPSTTSLGLLSALELLDSSRFLQVALNHQLSIKSGTSRLQPSGVDQAAAQQARLSPRSLRLLAANPRPLLMPFNDVVAISHRTKARCALWSRAPPPPPAHRRRRLTLPLCCCCPAGPGVQPSACCLVERRRQG